MQIADPLAASQPDPFPRHLSVRTLLRSESSWDDVQPSPSATNQPHGNRSAAFAHHGPFPKTEAIVFDTIEQWLLAGRCNTPSGHLNLKQAAYLLLVGTWLQATLNRSWGCTQQPPPFQTSLLLGGPGTGKTFISNLCLELIHCFLPQSTLQAAFTHRASRLIGGQTLHACLGLPFDTNNIAQAAKSLGRQKDNLQQMWRHVGSFFVDEVSMLSNELLGLMDLRCRQISGQSTLLWGGYSVRFDGDFHQLPPVGQSSLLHPPQPTNNSTAPHQQAQLGAQIWKELSSVVILDHSHRCSGPLQTILTDLVSDRGISNPSWNMLQTRLLSAADHRLQEDRFAANRCPVGVMRHTVRALKTLQRAQEAAAAAGHRLLLAVAADRCSFANRPLPLDPALAQEAAAVHTLSVTANLPSILALFPGVELCLETKLCATLGLVRGCTVVLDDILFPDNEPSLASLFFFHLFFFLWSPSTFNSPTTLMIRFFERDPTLEPHPLLHLPTALLLKVPGAQWVKHPELGPGRFLLSPRSLPWQFYPAHPPADGLHFDSDQKAYLQLQRCQFPLTNLFSMTHYQLQGQTLPAIILDLARPPGMSAVAWKPHSLSSFSFVILFFICCILLLPLAFPSPSGCLLDRLPRASEPCSNIGGRSASAIA